MKLIYKELIILSICCMLCACGEKTIGYEHSVGGGSGDSASSSEDSSSTETEDDKEEPEEAQDTTEPADSSEQSLNNTQIHVIVIKKDIYVNDEMVDYTPNDMGSLTKKLSDRINGIISDESAFIVNYMNGDSSVCDAASAVINSYGLTVTEEKE